MSLLSLEKLVTKSDFSETSDQSVRQSSTTQSSLNFVACVVDLTQ